MMCLESRTESSGLGLLLWRRHPILTSSSTRPAARRTLAAVYNMGEHPFGPCSGAAEPRPEGQRYNSLDVVSTTWGEAGRKFQPRSISLDFPEYHRYLAPAWHAAPAQAVAADSILCAIVVLGAPPASPIPLPPLTGSTFSHDKSSRTR